MSIQIFYVLDFLRQIKDTDSSSFEILNKELLPHEVQDILVMYVTKKIKSICKDGLRNGIVGFDDLDTYMQYKEIVRDPQESASYTLNNLDASWKLFSRRGFGGVTLDIFGFRNKKKMIGEIRKNYRIVLTDGELTHLIDLLDKKHGIKRKA